MMSLCLSYSSAEEQTGLLGTIKSFFGAIPPAEVDRGEGTSRILTPSSKKNSSDKQDNTTPVTSSVTPSHDGYWKESTLDRASEHSPLMEEPGALMADGALSPPFAPAFSMDGAASSIPPNDFIEEPALPIETMIQEGLIPPSQQPSAQKERPLLPAEDQIATGNTTPTSPFSTAPYPIQLEPAVPQAAMDETLMARGEENLPQQSNLSTPQYFPPDDTVDDFHSHP